MNKELFCKIAYKLRWSCPQVMKALLEPRYSAIHKVFTALKHSETPRLTPQAVYDMFAPQITNSSGVIETAYRCHLSPTDAQHLVKDQSYQNIAVKYRSYRVLNFEQLDPIKMVKYAASRI